MQLIWGLLISFVILMIPIGMLLIWNKEDPKK